MGLSRLEVLHVPVCVYVFTSPNNGPQPCGKEEMDVGGKHLEARAPLSASFQHNTHHQITYFIVYVFSFTSVFLSLLDYKILRVEIFACFIPH